MLLLLNCLIKLRSCHQCYHRDLRKIHLSRKYKASSIYITTNDRLTCYLNSQSGILYGDFDDIVGGRGYHFGHHTGSIKSSATTWGSISLQLPDSEDLRDFPVGEEFEELAYLGVAEWNSVHSLGSALAGDKT